MKLKIPFGILLFAFFVFASHAQRSDPQIRQHKISEQIYVLYGGGGLGANVGVIISDDGILLIDGMVKRSNAKLLAAIRNISDKPNKYVINTHSDSDHSGSTRLFYS